jgi:Thrombospondin C-terminal region
LISRTITLAAAIVVGLVASASSSALTAKTYTFTSTRQGVAHGGKWKDDRSSILQADGSGKVAFPLFVFNSPRFGGMDYAGEFLIESGNEDRYAGFVFRLRDAGDYYAVRFSASENNVFFARFDNGVRTVLRSFNASVSSKQWHKVRLVARRNAVTIFLDGRKVGTVSDARWRIGKVGLGTKADSVTRFRKLTVTAAGSGG